MLDVHITVKGISDEDIDYVANIIKLLTSSALPGKKVNVTFEVSKVSTKEVGVPRKTVMSSLLKCMIPEKNYNIYEIIKAVSEERGTVTSKSAVYKALKKLIEKGEAKRVSRST